MSDPARCRRWILPALALLALSSGPVAATTVAPVGRLQPEGAELTSQHVTGFGSYALPVGPWVPAGTPAEIHEGEVIQSAWRWSDSHDNSLALFAPLRDRLLQTGWELVFECEALSCGGFDFRYTIRVLPEPDMHVDLADFRYLAARRGAEVLSLLVSRSDGARAGFAQVIEVGPATAPRPKPQVPTDARDPIADLREKGAMILPGLRFASGGARVTAHDPATLTALSAFLRAHPDQRLILTGHSDSSGNAEANLRLSQDRAESLRALMIAEFGADPARLQAEGAGDATPVADNASPEGREKNRRVEVRVAPPR